MAYGFPRTDENEAALRTLFPYTRHRLLLEEARAWQARPAKEASTAWPPPFLGWAPPTLKIRALGYCFCCTRLGEVHLTQCRSAWVCRTCVVVFAADVADTGSSSC